MIVLVKFERVRQLEFNSIVDSIFQKAERKKEQQQLELMDGTAGASWNIEPIVADRKSKGYALQSNYGLPLHASLEPSLIHLVANTIKRSLIQLDIFIHR